MNELKGVISRLGKAVQNTAEKALLTTIDGLKKNVEEHATLDSSQSYYPRGDYKYDNVQHFASYMESFKSQITKEGNTTKGKVLNDYLVNTRHGNIPFGHLLEWGTGLMGMQTQDGTWGYGDYTDVPWDVSTHRQLLDEGTFGMSAHPHWTQAYQGALDDFKNNFRNNLRNL